MMDDVEQIEARLCAYVDGQLTGAEREEIERHLAATPSHQILIRDLIAQRQMLRRLPRESAPVDLADPLQSQLEREVLLGGEPFGECGATLPVIRWSQYLAVAAIVLLALGLISHIIPHILTLYTVDLLRFIITTLIIITFIIIHIILCYSIYPLLFWTIFS
jgi:anti-sigma factor RsiW